MRIGTNVDLIRGYLDFLNNDAIQRRRIAPIVDVIKLPMMLDVDIPKSPNTQPPKTPPTIPNRRLIKSPKPPPRMILPAK